MGCFSSEKRKAKPVKGSVTAEDLLRVKAYAKEIKVYTSEKSSVIGRRIRLLADKAKQNIVLLPLPKEQLDIT